MKFLRIFKKIHEVGFDEFHQAGYPSVFSKMNIVAESKVLNKQFWICVDGGYRCKDSYYIASRSLDNTDAVTERKYCKNQSEIIKELEKMRIQILNMKNRQEVQIMDMEYVRYSVGEKYDKVMERDGAVFEMNSNVGIITVGISNITSDEQKIMREGKLDLYLSVVDGIIFVTIDFEHKLVFDMPFNSALYDSFEMEHPLDKGYFVPVIIVENTTNMITAIRAVGLDNNFSTKLYRFAKEQWKNCIQNYDERLKNVYNRWSVEEIISFAVAKNGKNI